MEYIFPRLLNNIIFIHNHMLLFHNSKISIESTFQSNCRHASSPKTVNCTSILIYFKANPTLRKSKRSQLNIANCICQINWECSAQRVRALEKIHPMLKADLDVFE